MSTVREFNGIILKASNGLKTKLDVSGLKYKKTFLEAKRKHGIDLNNTNKMFKKDGTIWLVSVMRIKHSDGKTREYVNVYPFLNLIN